MQETLIQENRPAITSKPDPSKIMQIGMGFWASKVVLSAVKFGLFTLLAAKPRTEKEIKEAFNFGTTDRHVSDWLDTLVSLGFLQRIGNHETAEYINSPDTDLFLDRNKPSYIGGILEMSNNRLYGFWGNLEEGLITGQPQNESRSGNNMQFFDELYKDPVKLQEFVDAMSGIQMGNFLALVNKFDFSKYNSVADIGGADGWLSIQICLRHTQVQCITFDLSPVEPIAKKKVDKFELMDRIRVVSGNFLNDELPAADVITMGNILHGMNEEAKEKLIRKVYNALPENGVLIAIENVIDNDRNRNTFGLLMSLNMLIENGDGFDYTGDDFDKWTKNEGFARTEIIPLAGPASAAIAYKGKNH